MIRLAVPPDVPPDLDGEDPQHRPPLSWRDWLELALLVIFASGCAAGLVLGIDRALNGPPVVCVGALLGG